MSFGPQARVALYYAPAADDPLWQAGTAWLGRDPASGAGCSQPPVAGLAAITAEARRYGFHATLKPPMRLRAGLGWADLRSAAAEIAAAVPVFTLPRLEVADLDGFLALRETTPCPPLQALADLSVAIADPLRAPPDRDELARRRASVRSPAQAANLVRWGYAHVFTAWFFHMTLTRRLDDAERARLQPQAEAYFAPALTVRRLVADIALFVQPDAAADFILTERFTLRG